MTHQERIYVGLALQYRYANKAESDGFKKLHGLLEDKDRREAEVLGKAMRFGAMLWTRSEADRGAFKWFPKKKVLEYRVTKAAADVFGEVPEARLRSLAASLEAELIIKMPR